MQRLARLHDWVVHPEKGRRVLGAAAAPTARALRERIYERAEQLPRPETRADCVDGVRPCPWVGCRHHLALDMSPKGSLRLASANMALVRTGKRQQPKLINRKRTKSLQQKVLLTARAVEDVFDFETPLARMKALPTCSLDEAAKGEHNLIQIGRLIGLTRERVRQIEVVARAKFEAGMRAHYEESEAELGDRPITSCSMSGTSCGARTCGSSTS